MKASPVESIDDLTQRGYRFAFSLTHDAARADDLLQDAWLAVLKARGPWTISYLFRAIRHRYIDQWRRDRLVEMEPLDDRHLTENIDEEGVWSDDEPVWALARDLDRALGRLHPDERTALYLSAVEGYTAREIAELLDRPRGTILSLVFRARQKLRRMLTTDEEVNR